MYLWGRAVAVSTGNLKGRREAYVALFVIMHVHEDLSLEFPLSEVDCVLGSPAACPVSRRNDTSQLQF